MYLLSEGIKQIKRDYIDILKKSLSPKDVKNIQRLLFHLNVLSPKKQKHSIRVSQNTAEYSSNLDVIIAALFHDYVERGGNIEQLPITTHSKDIIHFLTAFDYGFDGGELNEPLEHLKNVFTHIDDQKLKNRLVIIKLSDRLDNIKKRGNNISKEYIRKSIELLQFLRESYQGNLGINKIIKHLNNKLK